MLLSKLLRTTIRCGTLNLIDSRGRLHRFQGTPEPSVTVRLHSRKLERRLYFTPDLALGEGYMDGSLTIEDGSLATLFEILFSNLENAKSENFYALRTRMEMLFRRFQQFNPASISRKNVAHYYDLPDKIYDWFLDEDKQYSCAYFENADDDLSTAQTNKKRHLAAKFLLSPGQKILDIGSGWGGLALYLAQAGGGKVTGLTLSESQIKISRERAPGKPA